MVLYCSFRVRGFVSSQLRVFLVPRNPESLVSFPGDSRLVRMYLWGVTFRRRIRLRAACPEMNERAQRLVPCEYVIRKAALAD